MPGSNAETLQAFIDLVRGGRLEEAFTRLAPNVVVHEAEGLPYRGSYEGPTGFGDLLRRVAEVVDLEIEHTDLFDAGPTVVARMQTTLTGRDTGRSLPMLITEIYSFTPDGRISYVDVFYKDTAAVVELLGGVRA